MTRAKAKSLWIERANRHVILPKGWRWLAVGEDIRCEDMVYNLNVLFRFVRLYPSVVALPRSFIRKSS